MTDSAKASQQDVVTAHPKRAASSGSKSLGIGVRHPLPDCADDRCVDGAIGDEQGGMRLAQRHAHPDPEVTRLVLDAMPSFDVRQN